MAFAQNSLALIVRSVPYRQRSARSQLDVALVAAALERPLRIYFVGAAALQLLAERRTTAAHLPGGYRAWASVPELTGVRVFAEPGWIERLRSGSGSVLPDPEPMDAETMRDDWRSCDAVMVL